VIVVGGEALVDLVPVDGQALQPRLGGGPFNIAVAIGRLGRPVGMLARLSTDTFGEALYRQLVEAGVDTTLVTRGAEPTALALATLGPDGSARYTFYTVGTAGVAFADPGPLPPVVHALSVGSLGLVLEPGASSYEAVLQREAKAGRLVALDPNVRAALIADATAYRERFRGWLSDVSLLKLSIEDAEWLAEGMDTVAAVRQWLAHGPRAVVLTKGQDGLDVHTRSGLQVSAAAAPVAVVDTIGAGDTVQAALLARLDALGALQPDALGALDEAGWWDVLDFAARAAAITCSRPGADPPWAAELASR
jgi:fructokinase